MILHTGPKGEAGLRELGFTIPEHPATGAVSYKGQKVGNVDNFAGLTIKNEFTDVCQLITDNAERLNIGLWNDTHWP